MEPVVSRQRRWQLAHPDRARAQTAVADAIRTGRLVPGPCEACGAVKAQAHHDDYGKPLEVRWLCAACHARWHAAARRCEPASVRDPMAHPILRVLKDQGRSTVWLARQVRRHPKYLSQVFNARVPAAPGLRAACARALGVPERDLFDQQTDSSSAPQEGELASAGTAALSSGYPLPREPSIRRSA